MGEWQGWRLMLNCGHYKLGDHMRIGQLTACDVCPTTIHSPDRPGVPTAAVRQVVGHDQVQASREPEEWGPEWWHGA